MVHIRLHLTRRRWCKLRLSLRPVSTESDSRITASVERVGYVATTGIGLQCSFAAAAACLAALSSPQKKKHWGQVETKIENARFDNAACPSSLLCPRCSIPTTRQHVPAAVMNMDCAAIKSVTGGSCDTSYKANIEQSRKVSCGVLRRLLRPACYVRVCHACCHVMYGRTCRI
jgi:hypothetical protein